MIMSDTQLDKVWAVTNGIRRDVGEIKVCMARLDERSAAREAQFDMQNQRLDKMESKLQRLDMKVAAAMGMVALISYGLQLLVSV
jgi:division protein CdvB (Snf7/Vps24/ESCRT-III family)|tara:strand:+ start:1038 stop:1292 length:255 start_codon:yes stop_codon:yes gene_type:complete